MSKAIILEWYKNIFSLTDRQKNKNIQPGPEKQQHIFKIKRVLIPKKCEHNLPST